MEAGQVPDPPWAVAIRDTRHKGGGGGASSALPSNDFKQLCPAQRVCGLAVDLRLQEVWIARPTKRVMVRRIVRSVTVGKQRLSKPSRRVLLAAVEAGGLRVRDLRASSIKPCLEVQGTY